MRYFRTLLTFEVLHTEEFPEGLLPSTDDLDNPTVLAEAITDGGASGMVLEHVVTELTEDEVRERLIAQGSDPNFLIPNDDDLEA